MKSGFACRDLGTVWGLGLGLMGALSWAGWGAIALAQQQAPLPYPSLQTAQSLPPATANINGGTVVVAGQSGAIPWQQRGNRIGIADMALMQVLGVDLQDTANAQQQPVQWFSEVATPLATWHEGSYRYVDITAWAQQQGWQLSPNPNGTLTIQAPTGQILGGRRGRQTWGDRLVLEVDRPVVWSLQEQDTSFTLTLQGRTGQTFTAVDLQGNGNALSNLQVRPAGDRLVIQGQIEATARMRVWSLANPNRVVIDVRQDAVPKDIAWAPGVRWQSGMVTVGNRSFPVHQLRLNPQQVRLRPIWASQPQVPGITPLVTMARQSGAVAAINAGFFNRNNQLPLGAIRENGRWISGPILNRGAIAWNDQGQAIFNRLFLSHTLTTDQGRGFTVGQTNSGYVQAGIGLYTADWGNLYRPVLDNETLVTVRQNQVLQQTPGGAAGQGAIAVPSDGYLLAVRSYSEAARSLPPGTAVSLTADVRPLEFGSFPYAIGGGPLLVSDRRVVLNAQAEGFSDAFIREAAPRSAIGRTQSGELLLVAIHNSPGGRGPTLTETAQIMVQLGSVDALNLDGGSSASLYLGGTMLNRHSQTAGRVHNGLGGFLVP
ncbi:MAG: phosphodiester glycosidase family protein [Cyanobacteria bacterium]|nr:phosphodiester glycosidase family protein [Cyanobacteriota bacterium]